MEPLQIHSAWFRRKFTGGPIWSIKSEIRLSKRYIQETENDFISGELTIVASPAESFSFHSKAKWPEEDEHFFWLPPGRLGYYIETTIQDAILDVMFASIPATQVLVAEVTLESITWEAGHSDAIGFYWAAKKLMEKIIETDMSGKPINFQPITR